MDMQRLIKQLRIDEGVKQFPYKDSVGKLTIGIGRNIQDRGISDDEMDFLLTNDIAIVQAELDKHVPWWRNMTSARQEVLANMCFNMGWPVLSKFKNTLASMKAGNYSDAAQGMLGSKWASQVGKRADRLAKMMREG